DRRAGRGDQGHDLLPPRPAGEAAGQRLHARDRSRFLQRRDERLLRLPQPGQAAVVLGVRLAPDAGRAGPVEGRGQAAPGAGETGRGPDVSRASPRRPEPGSPLVVAYGAGVNSTAMLVEFARRGIRPDLVLFADTSAEKPETYEYL